jgi:hypothetical protein
MGAASAPGRDASILSPLSQAFGADEKEPSADTRSALAPLPLPSKAALSTRAAAHRPQQEPTECRRECRVHARAAVCSASPRGWRERGRRKALRVLCAADSGSRHSAAKVDRVADGLRRPRDSHHRGRRAHFLVLPGCGWLNSSSTRPRRRPHRHAPRASVVCQARRARRSVAKKCQLASREPVRCFDERFAGSHILAVRPA